MTNPYGVDFIVYGNAFNGNPEAGAVKVYGYTSADDTTGEWYDLAGSLYYDSLSMNNAAVSYKKIESGDDKGIWYRVNDNAWTKFNTNTSVAWWPETDEGYGGTWGNVDGVTWDQTNNIITYSGVSLVKDTDTTNDYQFGYFDIHVNGSNYGTASNPYAITNTESGGDGFDLAWAVDDNGNPVVLSHITKVRLYTAAALNSDGTAFTTPSIFGETSAEVCGVYKANGSGSGDSAAPTVVLSNNIGDIELTDAENQTVYELMGLNIDSVSIDVSGGSYIYINGVASTSTTVNLSDGSIHNVQIISQSGTASPYVVLLKMSK